MPISTVICPLQSVAPSLVNRQESELIPASEQAGHTGFSALSLPVTHVYQNNLPPGRQVCRFAALGMVKRFLSAQGWSPSRIRQTFPEKDIRNTQVIPTIPSWPGSWERPVARPLPDDLSRVLRRIDEHLNSGVPAIVYVRHDHKEGGTHAVVVTGRERDAQGNVQYRFLDPGSSSAEPRFFSFNGQTFVKARDQKHSNSVPHSQYVLLGIYPYLQRAGTAVADVK